MIARKTRTVTRTIRQTMDRIGSLLALLAVCLTGVVSGAAPTSEPNAEPEAQRNAEPNTEQALKARFRGRHAPLQRLKDAAKVGETTRGLVEVVRDAFRTHRVELPEEGTMTVDELLRAENADRRKLYEIIGNRTGEPADAVAEQAAIRNFRRASPSHHLKLRNGQWVQKKELPAPK